MLSRVAERLYWSARYLERIENIARLLSVYDDLLLDLPRDVKVSWYNLIEINGSVADFAKKFDKQNEHNVVRFLLLEEANPSSLLASLKSLRENIRTTRDVLPEETWELINELDLYAKKHVQKGIQRGNRYQYLNNIIEGCQKVIGLLNNAMCRDAGWRFMQIGRYLERADMNTRILDSAIFIKTNASPDEQNILEPILWPKVLKSQSGYLGYLRTKRTTIDGKNAVDFLLYDEHFPRSQVFCLQQIRTAMEKLPRSGALIEQVEGILAKQYDTSDDACINGDLSHHLNDIQLGFISVNAMVADNWFHFQHGDAV